MTRPSGEAREQNIPGKHPSCGLPGLVCISRRPRSGNARVILLLGALTGLLMAGGESRAASAARWWKGNLHTHTLWSDGNDYPEMVAAWYKDHGYHFLAISDHNVMLEGERWTGAQTNRGGPSALQKYLARFGPDWVDLRGPETHAAVRLKTLAEFRARLEEPGRFLLMAAEEITDRFEKRPVHLNGIHLRELIPPQGGGSVFAVLQNNVNAVQAQRERTGQPMFPVINHPNFGWALTAEDMTRVQGVRFFEVYNGHPGVRNAGDERRASTERIWDIILTRWLAELGLGPLWGLATDDAHGYHHFGPAEANPGRGWVMVRATVLTPEALIAAMEAGEFYASTGVRLRDVQRRNRQLRVDIEPDPGVTYRTQFIGTRRGYDPRSEPVLDADGNELPTTRRYGAEVGRVLAEVEGVTAVYRLRGDEIYVRAKVISSRLKANGVFPDEQEVAWTQPLIPKGKP